MLNITLSYKEKVIKKKVLLTLLSLACVLCCVLGLVACNDVAVTNVTLNKTELTLTVGGEETLTATVAPDNATQKEVTWASDKTDVATVANGKVTAVAVGSAKVTATAGGKSATCTVTVKAADTKMTEEEWKASCTAFVTANNYSMQSKVEGEVVSVQQADGTTFAMSDPSDETHDMMLTKDGNTYYGYAKYSETEGATPVWTKRAVSEETYNMYCGYSASIVATSIAACSANYSAFTYVDGKYTAATIHLEDMGDLKNIELTAEGTTWKKVTCSFVEEDGDDNFDLVIDNIGTTTIDVPDQLKPLLANVGNTAICESEENGGKYNVKGTCNFGAGTFDSLTGNAAYTLEYNQKQGSVEVTNQYEQGNPYYEHLDGYYDNWSGELMLSMSLQVGEESYYIQLTFEWESTNA